MSILTYPVPSVFVGKMPTDAQTARMDEELLRWAAPDEVVKLAKEAGMTTVQIVRIVSGCLPYGEALKVARDYAPLLEISVSEFMELRKNK